jgi:hypothetical protein
MRKSLAPGFDDCRPIAPPPQFHHAVIATQHRSSVATSTPVPNRLNFRNKARRSESGVGSGFEVHRQFALQCLSATRTMRRKELKGSFYSCILPG